MWTDEDDNERALNLVANNADLDSDNDDWGDSDSDGEMPMPDPAEVAAAASQRLQDFRAVFEDAVSSTLNEIEPRPLFPPSQIPHFPGLSPIRTKDLGSLGRVPPRQTGREPTDTINTLNFDSDSEISGSDVDEYWTTNYQMPYNHSRNLKWMAEYWPDCAPALDDYEHNNTEILINGNNMRGLKFVETPDKPQVSLSPLTTKIAEGKLRDDALNFEELRDFIRDAAIETEQELDHFQHNQNRHGIYDFASESKTSTELRADVLPTADDLPDRDVEVLACSTPNYVISYRLNCNDTVCAICRVPLESMSPLGLCSALWGDCGHCFHRCCIEEWLLRSDTCPMDNLPWILKYSSRYLFESRRDRLLTRGIDKDYVPELDPISLEDGPLANGAGHMAIHPPCRGFITRPVNLDVHQGYRARVRRPREEVSESDPGRFLAPPPPIRRRIA